jgi:hypothetical protein
MDLIANLADGWRAVVLAPAVFNGVKDSRAQIVAWKSA